MVIRIEFRAERRHALGRGRRPGRGAVAEQPAAEFLPVVRRTIALGSLTGRRGR
ncbi:hypothetical protein H4W23_34110 [Streptomyces gardneri]|nr:hypothetical protein H4W23_34110 [Streptomyces gardneri]CUM37016.1 hypothetical protein BN2537_2997 [Streptomyces venezuelae]